jgi:hypothetical protein
MSEPVACSRSGSIKGDVDLYGSPLAWNSDTVRCTHCGAWLRLAEAPVLDRPLETVRGYFPGWTALLPSHLYGVSNAAPVVRSRREAMEKVESDRQAALRRFS